MPKNTIGRILHGYAKRDRSEQKISPVHKEIHKIAWQLHSRLVNEHPDASDAEIDAKVQMIVDAGRAPTKDAVAPATSMKAVEDMRRAARKAEVRKRRKQRRA